MAIYELEERILFDGAIAADISEIDQPDQADDSSDHDVIGKEQKDSNSEKDSSDTESDKTDASDPQSANSVQPDSNDPLEIALNGTLAVTSNNDTNDASNQNVLLVSSMIKDANILANAANDNTHVIKYDPNTSLTNLLEDIRTELGDDKAASIGIAAHSNADIEGSVQITANQTLTADSIVDDSGHNNFIKGLDSFLTNNGKIDIFTSNLSASDSGNELIDAIENITHNDVNASNDNTGGADYGTDWLLEDGNVDVSEKYFDSHKLDDFHGVITPNSEFTPDTITEGLSSSGNSLYLVSMSAQGADEIIAGLPDGAKVEFIETSSDGVLQITDILRDYSDLDAIHIISEGNVGSLTLGLTYLNKDAAENIYANDIASWGQSLSKNGDILFYSCDTAKGDAGVDFIGTIAELTGADIAASTNFTGGTVNANDIAYEGDWILEYNTGNIETTTFSLDSSFNHLLRVATWDGDINSTWATAANWDTDTAPVVNVDSIVIANVANDPNFTGNLTYTALTINAGGNLTVSDGTLTVTGMSVINGTLNISGGTYETTGDLNLNDPMSSAITISTGTVNIGGNLMSLGGGNISVGAGTLTVTGNFEAMGCALEIATGTVDVGGNFNIDGGMFGSVTFTDAGSLYLGGTVIDLGNFTAGTGTVIYDSITIAQDVLDVDYYNLSIEGSTAKTLTADLGASDDRINNLTVDGSAANLDLNTSGYDIYANSLDIISTPEADPDPDPYLQPDLEFSTAGYIWDNGDGRATILNISGISNISGDITTQGTQTYTGAVTLTGDAYFQASDDIEFTSTISGSEDTGSNDLIIVSEGGTLTFGDTVGNLGKIADIGIASDDISITAAVTATSGDIILANLTPNATIGLAGGAGTYQLSNDEFNLLNAESNTVAIGSSATNTGTITIGLDNNNLNAGSRFSNLHLTTLNEIDATAGSITVENLAITAGGNVEISHANTDVTTLAATFTNTGNLIFEDANTLTIGEVGDVTGITMNDGSVSITTGGQLDIDQVITAAGDGNGITVTGNQDIVISNKNLTTAAGDINLNNSAITLDTGAVQLSTGGASAGDILIGGEVSGTQALTLNAGTGSVDLDSFSNVSKVTILDVTGSTGINIAGDIYTSSTQDYNSAVTLTNDVIFDADDNNITFDSTIAGINPDDLTIDAGTGTITFSGIVGGYNQINAIDIDAGTLTQKGAITAQGQLDIDVTSSYNMAHDLTGGEGGSGDTNITIANAGQTFTITADKTLSSIKGALTITVDDMDISGAIAAGAQTVTLQNYTENLAIYLGAAGEAARGIVLTDTELDLITAGVLHIGDSNTERVYAETAIDPNNVSTLHLQAGSGGSGISDFGSITVANLAVTSGASVSISNANTDIGTIAVSASGQSVNITDSNSLTVGSVDTIDGITGSNVTLTTTLGDLTINDTDAANDINASGLISISTNEAAANIVVASGANIQGTAGSHDYTSDNMDLQGTITATGQTVTIVPQANRPMILGTGDENSLVLSNTELGNITADKLILSFTDKGALTIDSNVDIANVSTVHLKGTSISGTAGGIRVDSGAGDLAITSKGDITLTNSYNDVNKLAVTDVDQSIAISYTDANALTIDTVDGIDGITTNFQGDVTLTTGGTLTINQAIQENSITVIGDNTIVINGVNLNSSIDIDLGDSPITLASDAVQINANSGDVSIGGAISGGGQNLTINGNTSASIAGITNVNILDVTSQDNGITFNGDISTTGTQTYNSDVLLAGNISLTTTDDDITFSGSVEGDSTDRDLTIDAGTGNVTFNNAATTNLGAFSVTSDDITINNNIGATTLTLAPSTAGNSIGLAGADGDYLLTSGNLGAIISTTTLIIGSAGAGAIEIGSDNVSIWGATNVHLKTSETITATDGSISVTNLALTAGGAISMTHANNDVTTLAIATTDPGDVSFTDSNGLEVGSVDVGGMIMAGIMTNNGAVTLTPGGNSTISEDIDTSSAINNNITINGTFNITIEGVNLITNGGNIVLGNNGMILSTGTVELNTGADVGGNISLGASSTGGNQALILNAGTGLVNIPTSITGLNTLDVTGSDGINIGVNTGSPLSLTTTGTQDYHNAVSLIEDVTFTTTNSNVTFDNTIVGSGSARDLTVSAGSGTTWFKNTVGTNNLIDNISVNSDELKIDNTMEGQGNITLFPTVETAITLGAGTAGFDLSAAELARLTTTGVLTIGDESENPSGAITIDADIPTVNVSTLHLKSGGTEGEAITATAGKIIVTNLVLNGTGDVTLDNAENDVDNLAAAVTSGDFTFTDTDALTIGTVNGISGIAITTSGAVSLTLDGQLDIDQSITAAGSGNAITIDNNNANIVISGETTLTSGGGAGGDIDLGTSDITLNTGAVVLSTTAESAGDIRIGGTVTGGNQAFTINAGTGSVSVAGMTAIGDTMWAMQGLTITGSGGITLNGDITTVSDPWGMVRQTYNNAVTLGDNITLTGSTFTFAETVNGNFDLEITGNTGDEFIGASVTFSDIVGGVAALNSIIITDVGADAATSVTATADITTNNEQTYNGSLTVGGSEDGTDVTLEGTTITVIGSIDSSGTPECPPDPEFDFQGSPEDNKGSSLTITGNLVAQSAIGSLLALSELTVSGTSSIAGNVTTALKDGLGDGSQTYNGAVTLAGSPTLTSTGGTIEFSSTIDNDDPARERGLVTVGTTIFGGAIGGGVNGALASVDVTGAVTIGGNITTSDTQDYTSTFELTDNTVLTASDNDITFGGNVLGDYKLTVAAGTGDINFDSTVGATTALSGLVVESAAALAFDSTVDVDVEGIDITAGTVTFNNTVTTTTNGSVEITNSGLLLIAAAAEMDLDGAFTQNGAGFVATAGDITTTNDNISFETIVTLTGATAFSTGAGIGDITFTDQLDGAQDIDLTAGTGNIFFTGAVGSTTEVGAITINSAVDVTAESTIEAESFVQIAGTGITTFNGDITTTEAEGLDITANNGIILDGINIVASAGVVTFNDDVNITTDAVDIDAADNITFAGALTSTDAQDLTLASDENIDFDEAVGYGDDNELGAISITTAADVTADGTIEADSFVQTAGTGTTTFNGDITTTEAEGVDIAADTGIVLDGINIVASAGVVTFNDDVNITTAAVDIDAADTIAFAGALTSTDAQDLTLASDANIYFDEAVGSGDDNELGSITIDTAVNVTADSTIEAASFVQSAGTGTTTFNGALNTNTSAGINLTGNIFNINSTITTTNNGIVEITNAGLLTIASAADMTLDGAFTQNGAGLVSTAGDITTSNDDISFATAVTLTGDVALDTGTGTTTFLSTINGANTLDITGNAAFNNQVGNTTALTSLSVSGTSSVANNITTTGAQSYTGLVTLTGVADTTKTFKTTNSDINFTGGVTNANSHLTVSAGSGTVTLGSGKSIDINGLLTKAGSGNFVTNGGDITAGGLSVTAGIFNSANAAGNWDINGDVAISTNATLNVTSATATVSGNWTNSGTFNSQTGTVNLNGSSEQRITSNGSNFYDLALNNSAGATINDDASINNTLTLTAGLVTLGNSNLTVTGLIKGIGGGVTKADFSSSNMILTNGSGKVKKGVSGAGNYFMPIGTKAIYSPINFYFPTGTFAPNAYVEASVVAEKYSENKSTTNYLNKYWITNTENISNFKASVSFYYAASDVVGKEISIIGAMYNNNVETSLDKVDTANQPITGTIKDIGVFTGISAPSSPVEEPKPEAEPAEATPTINNPTQTPTDSPWQPIIDSPGENSGDVKDITDNLPLAAPGLSSQKSNNNYASSPTITIGGVIINNTAAGDGGADPSIVGGVDIANNAVGADGVDFSQTVDGVFGGTAIIGSEVSIVGIEGASEAMKSNNDSGETNTAAKDGIIKNAKDVKIDIDNQEIIEEDELKEESTTPSKKSDSKKTQDTTHNKKHIGKEINNESQLLVSIDDLYFNKLEQQGKTYVDDILGDVDYSNIEYLTKGKYDIFKSDFDKAIDQFIAA